jgi:hypothetical protein
MPSTFYLLSLQRLMRADLSRIYILSFLFPGVSSTPNISSCACASTTHCKSADYLKLEEKIVTFVSFLNPLFVAIPQLQKKQISCETKIAKIENTSTSEFSFSPQADVVI